MFFAIIPAVVFGWALGANDAANVYGTAVTSGLVKYRVAVVLSAIFIVIGALLEGSRGLETISSVSSQTLLTASVSTIGAALSMTIMTYLGIPSSSSQAMMGAILGIGILNSTVDWSVLTKVVICWIVTPIGAAIGSFFLYKLSAILFRRIKTIQAQDLSLKIGALIIGAYGSYALGANNVANVTGPLAGIIPYETAALVGGLSIALGVLTFSKRVMLTVGKQITLLDHFSAVIAVLSQAITVWVFAVIGVPVSTSQAIVGAVIGAGLARGSSDINFKILRNIALGWLQTPLIAGFVSLGLYLIVNAVKGLF
ncbi:phosphate/sulfate permease [Mesotoga prima MesG1.Ag.4.2]|jgi:PiT family inorganic phosphate transporter|uniref:Phosphate/sulfate permease n=1 Tax=Mesotoga prima MesG1.Ag.4.2 TaxID=660470 RepID=I2F8Q7_9BACT|nr:inorganic phosphate transporter [Mesotoga prima]AFK08310.1 phosphate/sulfate permease [Mesotoga prima MesG1.Ag.4.2]